MQIESYEFGKVVINGRTYTSDVLITGGRIYDWWRNTGHLLQPSDLNKIWKHSPEVLVIGTGASGAMKVSDETRQECLRKGIELKEHKTPGTIKEFNRIAGNKKVACGLHLTC